MSPETAAAVLPVALALTLSGAILGLALTVRLVVLEIREALELGDDLDALDALDQEDGR